MAASPNWEVWMSKGTLELSNAGRNGALGIEGVIIKEGCPRPAN